MYGRARGFHDNLKPSFVFKQASFCRSKKLLRTTVLTDIEPSSCTKELCFFFCANTFLFFLMFFPTP